MADVLGAEAPFFALVGDHPHCRRLGNGNAGGYKRLKERAKLCTARSGGEARTVSAIIRTTGGRTAMTDNDKQMNDSRRSRFDALLGETAVGLMAGAATGESAGAALGAATPLAVRGLTWAVREFRGRVLGHREAVRVINAITVAKARIDERLEAGDLPRSDGFSTPGRLIGPKARSSWKASSWPRSASTRNAKSAVTGTFMRTSHSSQQSMA